MSLHLEFEPHSWYKSFAIQQRYYGKPFVSINEPKYIAYTENGNTYRIDEEHADTLKELKQNITAYHARIAERDEYNRRMIGE